MKQFIKYLIVSFGVLWIGAFISSASAAAFPFYQTQLGTGTPTSGYLLTSTGAGSNAVASWQAGTDGGTWGSITGTLSAQTDLQTALNAKQNTITTGTTAQYLRGNLSLATFPTTVSTFTNDSGYLVSSALAPYATLASPTFTGTVSGITATMVGAPSGSGTSTGTNTGDNAVNSNYASDYRSTNFTGGTNYEFPLTFGNGLTRTVNAIANNLITGVSGNQTAIGSTSANGTLTFEGNNNASGNTGTNANLTFNVGNSGGTTAMTILNNGNVGIGTTAPTNILSLGGTTAHTIWMERNTTAATAGQGLSLSSGGAIAGTNNLAGGDLTLKSGISTGTGTSALHFFTATAGSSGSIDNTPTEKMTILGNGNVGIGTTTPGQKLDLAGNMQISEGNQIQWNYLTGSAGLNDGLQWFRAGSFQTFLVGDSASGDLVYTNAGVEEFRVTHGGNVAVQGTFSTNNVGLGTTVGFGLSSINGNYYPGSAKSDAITFKTFQGNGGAQNSRLTITTSASATGIPGIADVRVDNANLIVNGNVGIGTTSPLSKLTVSGHIGTLGTIPTLTSAGTGASITTGSTDTAGEITEGTLATGAVITFATAYTNTPFVTVVSEAGLVFSYTVSNTAITITNIGALSSTKLTYYVIANGS
jgi:hypothetical protein